MRALLVIDMLNDFLLPEGKLSMGKSGTAIIPAIKEAVKRSRLSGEPVIYICDCHRPDDAEFAMFPPHCLDGTGGALVHSELQPQEGDLIIPKRRYSAFFATPLDLALRELGVNELLVTGVCTNICVLFTVADARNLGYAVTVFKDAVAGFDNEAHQFALKEIANTLGAKVKEVND